MRVVVVGLGYVGLPVAVRAVEVGLQVVGYDVDPVKVSAIQAGRSPIGDVTDEALAAVLSSGGFTPTTDEAALANFDVAVITVPTPLRDGAPDLSYIEAACRTLGALLRRGAAVILESTSYPGTTEEVVGPMLAAISGLEVGIDFSLGFSPERIDPGNRNWNFVTTPKVVSGVDPASTEVVRAFYDLLIHKTVVSRGTREAELSKLLENTFRHVNIALVNELAIQAHQLDIDIWDVIRVASTKPFGFMSFYPGPGVGGHCLPIDPSYLSWKVEQKTGAASRFVDMANDINRSMPLYIVHRVQLALNNQSRSVRGSRVLVLGLAYKADSNDARETPVVPIVRALLDLGADVVIHDALVGAHDIDAVAPRVPLSVETLRAANLVLLLTPHSSVDGELVMREAAMVLDTRNWLHGPSVQHL